MARAETPVRDFGWPAPSYSLKDPAGTTCCSRVLMGPAGFLVAFLCDQCPNVIGIAARMVEGLHAFAARGVRVAAIMSNDCTTHRADAPDHMIAFGQTHGLAFPYLADKDQSVARAFGAICTPDFRSFKAVGALHYRGRLVALSDVATTPLRGESCRVMDQIVATGTSYHDQTAQMRYSSKWH